MFFRTALLAALTATSTTLVSAAHDSGAKLTKPALESSLDYLHAGLASALKETGYTKSKWGAGWIPQECKDLTGGEISSVKFDPNDFEVFNIKYADCGDAWVFCHHKNSPQSIDSIAKQFSKVPIQMRQWVRHVIDVPGDTTWAFEYDGTITLVKPTDQILAVMIHETGHSLDLSGAYADKPVSSSDKWWDNYKLDANVPDNYAMTNMVEDVAQVTVVSVFNENVPGGFGSVEKNWNKIFHQYATLIAEANAAGKGNGLFKPGENMQCTHKMPPSAPVKTSGSAKRDPMDRRNAPFVRLSSNVIPINTGRTGADKHSKCALTAGH